ncbi:MAG: putative lipoprotein [Osedax symbiont Rs1]|nr:MAG: putative lipoprotein [Osedax symbiont Rs1]
MPNLKLASLIMFATLATGCASLVGQTADQPITSSPGLRSAGTMVEDEIIETKILFNFTKGSQGVQRSHINVVSFNENVLLVGQAPSEEAKFDAADIARSARKVKRVHNELEVAGPTSLIIRTHDLGLTAVAKGKLLLSANAKGLRIKIITEDSTVFLMGLVTRDEAQAAVDEIVSITGVRKIVKVFEYID